MLPLGVVFTPIIGFFRKKPWHAHEVQRDCFLKIWKFLGTWEHNTNNEAGISSTHLFFFSYPRKKETKTPKTKSIKFFRVQCF
jgi:hypothetical protein